MTKKRKRKSKYEFIYWLAASIIICGLLGYLLDGLAIGIFIGIAIGGFISVISRAGA